MGGCGATAARAATKAVFPVVIEGPGHAAFVESVNDLVFRLVEERLEFVIICGGLVETIDEIPEMPHAGRFGVPHDRCEIPLIRHSGIPLEEEILVCTIQTSIRILVIVILAGAMAIFMRDDEFPIFLPVDVGLFPSVIIAVIADIDRALVTLLVHLCFGYSHFSVAAVVRDRHRATFFAAVIRIFRLKMKNGFDLQFSFVLGVDGLGFDRVALMLPALFSVLRPFRSKRC
jgi:hypothetical protein